MAFDQFHRSTPAFDGFDTQEPLPPGIPCKRPVTASLAGRPQTNIIFRVENVEAASALAGAMGPRDRNGVATGADAAVGRAASSSGSALPADLRERFESSLGTDLSAVRIHTGGESAEAAGAVGAKAYATGNDIHFGAGHYDPTSAFGVHLIAHEVAHTVQQTGSTPHRQNKLEVSAPQDAAEHEADRAADAMVAGQSAQLGSAPGLVARDAAPANGPTKAGVEVEMINDGPFKLTLSTTTDADGNREIAVNGSISSSIGPFPIGTSPFSWKAEVGGKVSGKLSAKKGEDISQVTVEASASGALTVHGGIAGVATAFGGGELTVAAPALTVTKAGGGWTPKLMGPIAISVAPVVGVESEPLGAKYQVDVVTIALAEIHSFSPLNVKPGASLVALGAKLNDIVGKVNAALIIVGAKDMPQLKKLPGLTAFLEAQKRKIQVAQRRAAAPQEKKDARKAHGYNDDEQNCEVPTVDPGESRAPEDLEPDCDPSTQTCVE